MFIAMQRSVLFGPSSDSGPREIVDTMFLPRPVRELVTGLAGYTASFPGSEDGRPLGRLLVDVSEAEFTGREVRVTCRFGLRDWSGDWSGDWDDTYAGVIQYAVYAELEDDEASGDEVTINGVEYNQAIQFFRSHLDLDANTRQPDNVIPLIAGKPTAIRVYADSNPPAGAGGLEEYRGELEVRAATRTETIETLARRPTSHPAATRTRRPSPRRTCRTS